MKVVRFYARDAADAVGQIRERLGTEAVVVSVTQVPVQGLGRMWRKPGLEVLAGVPDSSASSDLPTVRLPTQAEASAPAASTQPAPAAQLRSQSEPGTATTPSAEGNGSVLGSRYRNGHPPEATAILAPEGLGGAWRSGMVLAQMGLQPLHVEQVLERARASFGELPPSSLAQEIALARSALASFWRPPAPLNGGAAKLHVFLGPPGSGKTTVVCKWLAKTVLVEGRKARVWRLDTRAANFAGLLDLYGEILAVPVEREWRGPGALPPLDIGFVDLPGISAQDEAALAQLRQTLSSMPGAQVHLVLNAAYDIGVLLQQVRELSALPLSDIIFTHFDEEKRRGKLWNLVFGTNLPVRFFSAGQNIPGEFSAATPEGLSGA